MLSISIAFNKLLKTTCPRCYRHQNYATRKRFYRGTSVIQSDNKWEVTLDHRRLKTPNGQVLAVSSEPLARAIAAEWDGQLEYIEQPTMHLTALCNTALDNPSKLTSHDIASYLLDYFSTDTVLFHSDIRVYSMQQSSYLTTEALDSVQPYLNYENELYGLKNIVKIRSKTILNNNMKIIDRYLNKIGTDIIKGNLSCVKEEKELQTLQENKWTPILEWFEKRFNVKQEIATGLMPPPVNTQTRAVLARYFLSYDFAALSAMTFGVEALKSPILMLACVERFIEPKEAVLLSRLEEEYQLMRWGRVPWAHELNQAEMTSRVTASLLVIHSSVEKHSSKAKATPEQQSA